MPILSWGSTCYAPGTVLDESPLGGRLYTEEVPKVCQVCTS